jgi:hypothetical protein
MEETKLFINALIPPNLSIHSFPLVPSENSKGLSRILSGILRSQILCAFKAGKLSSSLYTNRTYFLPKLKTLKKKN